MRGHVYVQRQQYKKRSRGIRNTVQIFSSEIKWKVKESEIEIGKEKEIEKEMQ